VSQRSVTPRNAVRRKRVRAIMTFAMVGAVAGLSLGLFVSRIDQNPWGPIGLRGLVIGLVIGSVVGVGEQWLVPVLSRRVGFWALNTTRMALYGGLMLGTLTLVNAAGESIEAGVGLQEGLGRYVFEDHLTRDFLLSLVAVVGLASFLELRTLHNPGEVWRFLSGRYHYPREETRVFLFADLVGSTALADRLGNLAYSSLLRECFRDTSEAILAWRGQVYQIAGDGVIVTWTEAEGLRQGACVRCYFEMIDALARREVEYRERYDAVPRFRGAVHGGSVVTAWVGEAKKELAFHGDALNAAARIEARAKETGADCLASGWVLDRLDLPPELRSIDRGEVELRGKTARVALHAIVRADVSG
jgi:adenylate cyclase